MNQSTESADGLEAAGRLHNEKPTWYQNLTSIVENENLLLNSTSNERETYFTLQLHIVCRVSKHIYNYFTVMRRNARKPTMWTLR